LVAFHPGRCTTTPSTPFYIWSEDLRLPTMWPPRRELPLQCHDTLSKSHPLSFITWCVFLLSWFSFLHSIFQKDMRRLSHYFSFFMKVLSPESNIFYRPIFALPFFFFYFSFLCSGRLERLLLPLSFCRIPSIHCSGGLSLLYVSLYSTVSTSPYLSELRKFPPYFFPPFFVLEE